MSAEADPELNAMGAVLSALTPLDREAKARVLSWAAKRFEIQADLPPPPPPRTDTDGRNGAEGSGAPSPPTSDLMAFETLGELFSAASPNTDAQKVLVAAYWFQVRGGLSDFESQPVNTELKHLGHGVGNITGAIESLKNQKPSLVVQLRKSGQTRQARKKFKVTTEGIRAVDALVRAASPA